MKNSSDINWKVEKERTRFFDASDWLKTILAHPEFETICPWSLFTNEETFVYGLMPQRANPWFEILLAYPKMICHAPVPFPAEYLDACEWAKILLLHPKLGTKVPWKQLHWRGDKEMRLAWLKLLVCHPRFARHCQWSIFYHHAGENNPNEWVKLLQAHPEYIKYYLKVRNNQVDSSDITLITHREWSWIIAMRPELLAYAPKQSFTNEDWRDIIEKQPQLCPKRLQKR